jgi:hypothetical protein
MTILTIWLIGLFFTCGFMFKNYNGIKGEHVSVKILVGIAFAVCMAISWPFFLGTTIRDSVDERS